jgi:hypothetical protein
MFGVLQMMVRLFWDVVMFFLMRPRWALLAIVIIAYIEIAASVRVFWLLALGLVLLFYGARLRYRQY